MSQGEELTREARVGVEPGEGRGGVGCVGTTEGEKNESE